MDKDFFFQTGGGDLPRNHIVAVPVASNERAAATKNDKRRRTRQGRGTNQTPADECLQEEEDVDNPTAEIPVCIDVAQEDSSGDHAVPATQTGKTKPKQAPVRVQPGDKETSKDGTEWVCVAPGDNVGRRGAQNVLKETGGPTGYAKRWVQKDVYSSSLRLFLNKPILRLIKTCTEKEARTVLKDDSWCLLQELDAFLAILYARTLRISDLWNKTWGQQFFPNTMGRDQFKEILRFLRFDDKQTRSTRITTDKFCLGFRNVV